MSMVTPSAPSAPQGPITLYDSIELVNGAVIRNLTCDYGSVFPTTPTTASLFYNTDASANPIGLYYYDGHNWQQVVNAVPVIQEQVILYDTFGGAGVSAASTYTPETLEATSVTWNTNYVSLTPNTAYNSWFVEADISIASNASGNDTNGLLIGYSSQQTNAASAKLTITLGETNSIGVILSDFPSATPTYVGSPATINPGDRFVIRIDSLGNIWKDGALICTYQNDVVFMLMSDVYFYGGASTNQTSIFYNSIKFGGNANVGGMDPDLVQIIHGGTGARTVDDALTNLGAVSTNDPRLTPIILVANYAALPTTGITGKIYITQDTNTSYFWSGTAYVAISASSSGGGDTTFQSFLLMGS